MTKEELSESYKKCKESDFIISVNRIKESRMKQYLILIRDLIVIVFSSLWKGIKELKNWRKQSNRARIMFFLVIVYIIHNFGLIGESYSVGVFTLWDVLYANFFFLLLIDVGYSLRSNKVFYNKKQKKIIRNVKSFTRYYFEDFEGDNCIHPKIFMQITKFEVEIIGNKITVNIEHHRPGILIGKQGIVINAYEEKLKNRFGQDIKIKIAECKIWN